MSDIKRESYVIERYCPVCETKKNYEFVTLGADEPPVVGDDYFFCSNCWDIDSSKEHFVDGSIKSVTKL